MTTPEYLNGLNEPQREAVTTLEGPLLVLAGAGSGKTRVITHRIVHLIKSGVAPQEILSVTFTNKAAAEMRERAKALIAPLSQPLTVDALPLITTFHSLGVRLLREHHDVLNLKRSFTIYDRSDSNRAIKAALTEIDYDPKQFEPRRLLGLISHAKNKGQKPESFAESANSPWRQAAALVWPRYEKILKTEQALDFDDLLVKTLDLLEKKPAVRKIWQTRFPYLQVDEYQDTNHIQFRLAKVLAGEKRNICAVGDVDQNIYSWRGAEISNVLRFERHFPGAKTFFLEENYRSTKTIIKVSNEIINRNRNRITKTAFTNNEVGEPVSLYAAASGLEEAEYIAGTIKSLLARGVAPGQVAVLYRTNAQSRLLEEKCLEHKLPYLLLGTKFFERREVKDVLSYLRLALNPDSRADLARIINVPARGIGKVTLLKLLSTGRESLSPQIAAKVTAFDTIMANIRTCLNREPVSEVVKKIISESGLETTLKKNGLEEDLERLENLRELVSTATRYDTAGPIASAEAMLENVALSSDQDELLEKEEQPAVRLMTVYAAKGLEFSHVFIAGLEEGLFPHERLDGDATDEEEERRLFYVALTRAKEKLFLSFAHSRTIFGSQRFGVPSSFLADIDPDDLREENVGLLGNSPSGFEKVIFLD